jgi:hypothetical protein
MLSELVLMRLLISVLIVTCGSDLDLVLDILETR